MLRCILACDLLGGVVVRGVRGERDRYRPMGEFSRLVASSDPVEVIRALRPRETYVADLDRILGRGDNLAAIASLSAITRVMADEGMATVDDIKQARAVCQSVVLGTETASMGLIEACQGPGTVVSVDLRKGLPMARDAALQRPPLEVVKALNALDLDAVILLDVARVGSGEGVDLALLREAASASKHDVLAGGGVRNLEDLEQIERAGAAGAIIASAIHSGAIPADVLR